MPSPILSQSTTPTTRPVRKARRPRNAATITREQQIELQALQFLMRDELGKLMKAGRGGQWRAVRNSALTLSNMLTAMNTVNGASHQMVVKAHMSKEALYEELRSRDGEQGQVMQ